MKDDDDEENLEIFRYSESQANQYTRNLLDICPSTSKYGITCEEQRQIPRLQHQ